MTPKEKAIELVEKFYKQMLKRQPKTNYQDAIPVAIIAVKEMLDYTKEARLPMGGSETSFDYDGFLEETKTEL